MNYEMLEETSIKLKDENEIFRNRNRWRIGKK